jgi:hypothetical protein
MSRREANLLWIKDVLDHLEQTRQQLAWTDDTETSMVLTDSMLRDLERCQRLCSELKQRSLHRRAV